MLRKFVTDPLVDRLAIELSLRRNLPQHVVNAGCLVSVIQPLERVVVVAEPPVNGTVT